MNLFKNKFFYYLSSYIKLVVPSVYLQLKLKKYRSRYIQNPTVYKERLEYYLKLKSQVELGEDPTMVRDFKIDSPTAYYLDLMGILSYFPKSYRFNYLFGDVIHVPPHPTFVKSRPISVTNANSVLLKLNKFRHFKFVNDKLKHTSKLDALVWRGNVQVNQTSRINFLKLHYNALQCNVGHVNDYENNQWKKERLSIEDQLKYKFILSIEGNDVATNLKWVMSSHSIAVMPTPHFETWFMEGTLIPDYHYIHVKDDFSDLLEKLAYYSKHTDKAEAIVKQANTFVQQFKDKKQERTLSVLVLDRYFALCK